MNEMEKAQEKYENVIRKFNTLELLEYFSKKSLNTYSKGNYNGFTISDFTYNNKEKNINRVTKISDFVYGEWELVQICYDSIKYSHNNRGRKVSTSDFIYLIKEHRIYEREIGNLENMSMTKIFEYLQCLTNVQFDFQVPNTRSRFNRIYHMMFVINKNEKYCQTSEVCYIELEAKFKEITQLDYKKFLSIYLSFIVFAIVNGTTNVYDIVELDKKLGFEADDISNVLELISRNYDFYKKGDNWNFLNFYPIVKVSETKYIISNVYSLMISFPNVVYWIIRNWYKDNNSNDFLIYFGKCFEFYLKELFEYYNINCEKIKENSKEEVPDWKIETSNYIFLIEQKSALFSINVRTVTKEERYEEIEKYIKNNIIKAFKQLNSFCHENNSEKKIIKICLTFEKIYMEENLKSIIKERFDSDFDEIHNWILNIDEFEMLMEILNKNESEFNNIIESKLKLEINENRNGRGFDRLLGENKSEYTEKIINYYKIFFEELKERIKKE